MFRIFTACSLLLLVAGSAWAQPPKQEPRKLLLTPARPPVGVLRFALLPELRDQVPGDAGPIYKKAAEALEKTPPNRSERKQFYEWMEAWGQIPPADLPRDEVRKVLAAFKEPLDLLEKAARCENCDWGLSQRVRDNGVSALLPELQPMRMGIQVLCMKARLELADNRPDQALRTLQVAYVLGHRLGETPILIGCLVGVAITSITNGTLEQVLAHPKTPNLYWSLTNLPHPFIDMRKGFQGERLMVYGTFPGALAVANDLQAGPLTEEQIRKMVKMLGSLEEGRFPLLRRRLLALQVQGKHEVAKKALVAAGRPRDKVDQWPHFQVALMHALLEYDKLLDERLKWQAFPYYELQPALAPLDRKPQASLDFGPEAPALPLASLLLPATSKVLSARARLERAFAALRCVEAIRLYAAGHDDKFPTSLADIQVPLPICPVTGKPFEYRLQGDKALLSAPPVPAQVGIFQPLAYELTLRLK